MKLYDSDNNICNCALSNSLTSDLTVSFMITVSDKMCDEYKLFGNSKRSGLYITIDNKKCLRFYFGCKKTCRAKSVSLDDCESDTIHVTFVRASALNKCFLYLNGKLSSVSCYDVNTLASCEVSCAGNDFYFGNCESYTLTCAKISNTVSGFDDVFFQYALDTNNQYAILKYIYNHKDQDLKFKDNIYSYIMTEKALVSYNDLTPAASIGHNMNPEYPFALYNVNDNTRRVIESNFRSIQTDQLAKTFDIDEYTSNIISWQFGTNQATYPKYGTAPATIGYWAQSFGISPFTPWLSNSNLSPAMDDLANGTCIAFAKLLLDQSINNPTNAVYSVSVNNLVTYLNTLGNANAANVYGIVDSLPLSGASVIRITGGRYLNYLKLCDVFLSEPRASTVVMAASLTTMKNLYLLNLTTLLKLRFPQSIWTEAYANVVSGTPSVPSNPLNCNPAALSAAPINVPLYNAFESAQILLYLMNLTSIDSTVATLVTNAITEGNAWFNANKMTNYIQYYNNTTNAITIASTLPTIQLDDDHTLIPTYFSYAQILGTTNINVTVAANAAVCYNATQLLSVGDSTFPATFNTASANTTVTPYQFTTIVSAVLCAYNTWLKLSSACPTTNC